MPGGHCDTTGSHPEVPVAPLRMSVSSEQVTLTDKVHSHTHTHRVDEERIHQLNHTEMETTRQV